MLPLARLRPDPLDLIIPTAHRNRTIFALFLPLPLTPRCLFIFFLLHTSVFVTRVESGQGAYPHAKHLGDELFLVQRYNVYGLGFELWRGRTCARDDAEGLECSWER